MTHPKPLSMETVAQKAGVSKMTVSNVLRNARYVAPTTRKKVLKVVNELGYKTNPLVKSLMSQVRQAKVKQTTATLAYISPSYHIEQTLPSHQKVWYGAQEKATELNFRLERFYLDQPSLTSKRFNQILLTRNIRGLLITPSTEGTYKLDLEWDKFSAVTQGYTMISPELDRVVNDYYGRTQCILNDLTKKNYKRIGMILEREEEMQLNNTHLSALLSFQSNIPKTRCVPFLERKKATLKIFSQWLKKYQPDVVIGDEHIYQQLLNLNYRMPEDIGFVGMNLVDLESDRSRFNIDDRKVGEAAIQLLADRVLLNQTGVPQNPRIVLISGTWKDGATTR